MPAITITDLENAKTDVDHLAAIANSTALTATDRLGRQKRTLAGLSEEFPNAAANAAAAAAAATQAANEATSAATAVDLAFAEATAAQASRVAAEAARDAAMLSAGVYATTAAGLSATTSGGYFSVPSSSSYEHLILYQNNAGAALEIKRYPSSAAYDALDIRVRDSQRKLSGAITPTANLFNYQDAEFSPGFYVNHTNGGLLANATYDTSGFIPVSGGETYYLSSKQYIAWYNSSKVYISGSSNTDTNKVQTAPAGAAYLRMSILSAQDETAVYVTEGSSPLSVFAPYGGVVNGERVPDLVSLQAEYDKSIVALANGSNIYNSADGEILDNYRIEATTGLLSAVTGYFVTGNIPVTPGLQYFFPSLYVWAFYDASGEKISHGSTAAPLTAPAGAASLRISTPKTAATISNYWVATSSSYPQTQLSPYGYRPAEARLHNIPASALAGGITPEKLTTFKTGKNLYNKATRTPQTYIDGNGKSYASATYTASDFIAITPGLQYVSAQSMRFVTFYDACKFPLPLALLQSVTTFTGPANAYFARVSSNENSFSKFQLEQASASTAYQEFRYEARETLPSGEPVVYPSSGASVVTAAPNEYGLERLRETKQRLMSLKLGKMGLTARLTIGLIGDSWTHDVGRYSNKLATLLWSTYQPALIRQDGPIGPGYVSFVQNNGSIYWNAIISADGTWTSNNGTEDSPDIGARLSSTAGSGLTIQGAQDYTLSRSYTLIAEGGSGVVRYRWSTTGAWTTVDLSALVASPQAVALTDFPTTGTGAFRIEVVSGSVKLYGLNIVHPSSEGVVVHKLGATGTTAAQWAARNAARWNASLGFLAPDLVTVLHGTNDQASQTKAQFKASLLTIIDNIRTARPKADILLIAPCENQSGKAILMSDYAAAMYEIARDSRDVAYLNLQPHFGVLPSDYAAGSARPWFNVDGIHPEPTMGGYAIAAAIWPAISV